VNQYIVAERRNSLTKLVARNCVVKMPRGQGARGDPEHGIIATLFSVPFIAGNKVLVLILQLVLASDGKVLVPHVWNSMRADATVVLGVNTDTDRWAAVEELQVSMGDAVVDKHVGDFDRATAPVQDAPPKRRERKQTKFLQAETATGGKVKPTAGGRRVGNKDQSQGQSQEPRQAQGAQGQSNQERLQCFLRTTVGCYESLHARHDHGCSLSNKR
jgi:hypothetical protein